ncbi:MAG TPA: flagellar biosynthesis protein FlhB [Rhizomicrobium sp.]|jgi:flagellar biosynthetic protein FlhB
MADEQDTSQRTEEPTQRRLEEAQKHGDVVKSAEISTLVVLAGGALSIALFGHSTAEGFARAFRIFLEQPDQIGMDREAVMALFRGALWNLLGLLAPVFALIAGMGLAGHLLQHRPVFSAERLKPDLSKLSLAKGFKRMFGLDGFANLAKGTIKIAIVGAVMWMTVWPERGRLEGTLSESPAAIAGDMVHLLMRILIAALAVLAAIAAGDYMLQRYQFLKRNRMSRQEIRDEFRRTEGDPAIKARIRQLRIERAKRRMIAEVPKATVVITNPTHYSVALRYESGKTPAPICVAKGVDAVALRIREAADKHGVPIVENPPLARALYATVDLDEAVPPEHYKAVAQIIGYVMKLSGKARR